MADSDALRSRRKRGHAAGDHSLCRRCGGRQAAFPGLDSPDGGAIDRGEALVRLAVRLEAAHEANPADAAVARELRATLLALSPGEAVDSELAGLIGDLRA